LSSTVATRHLLDIDPTLVTCFNCCLSADERSHFRNMRSYRWSSLLATSLGLFAGAKAQTGTLKDLGSLLAGQKNLTTFYSLIQVYYAGQDLGIARSSTNLCDTTEIPRYFVTIAFISRCHCMYIPSEVPLAVNCMKFELTMVPCLDPCSRQRCLRQNSI
jgi:hypothetical protein